MEMSVYGTTDRGMVRPGNEDAVVVDEKTGLLVVADGMGGHKGGEIASRMAVDILSDYISRVMEGSDSFLGVFDGRHSREANLLASGIRLANRAIHEAATANPSWQGMGTTIVAALIKNDRAAVAHAGDSRLYRLHDGELRQVTEDHSLVAEQARQGLITAEEAARSSRKNVITRALGQWENLEIDMQDLALADGDRLLLCSDGLSGMVSDPEIAALLKAYPLPQSACTALVEVANSYGGKDNVTVVVAALQQKKGVLAGIRRLWSKG